MNSLLKMIMGSLIEPWVEPRVRAGSIKAVKAYLQAIKIARYAVMGLFGLGAFAAILVTGILLLIMGVVGLLPVDPRAVAWTATIIGAILTIAALVGAFILFSQRRWLQMSKSYELMDAVLSPWPSVIPPNPADVLKGEGPKGALRKEAPAPVVITPEAPVAVPPVDAPPTLTPQMIR